MWRPQASRDGEPEIRVGIDVVEVGRIRRVMTTEDRQRRVFTEGEIAYCRGKRRQYEHLAARFAAKEAVLKAFGTGVAQGIRWTDVEVVRDDAGRPRLQLDGEAAAIAVRRGLRQLDLSLTHTADVAFAQVVSVWDEVD